MHTILSLVFLVVAVLAWKRVSDATPLPGREGGRCPRLQTAGAARVKTWNPDPSVDRIRRGSCRGWPGGRNSASSA